MADFIYPSWSWIKTSEYPPNFLPAGSIVIDQTSEDGDCTVKGFYDPKTGEYHIQEVVHNVPHEGPPVGGPLDVVVSPRGQKG